MHKTTSNMEQSLTDRATIAAHVVSCSFLEFMAAIIPESPRELVPFPDPL
jgi:hypothetical protein